MRKLHKMQILNILQSMKEAGAKGDFASCQEVALSLCDFIDKEQGEGTKAVDLLETYAELCFKVNSGELSKTHLSTALADIQNEVHSTTTAKLEVAFFPYNVNKWDSLESIYLAARNDPNCEANVIPIPYYELVNGKQDKMHYHGDMYPPNIPIIDYKDYDITKMKPDVVFIHYAYDDAAANATVDPYFYTKNLKKYCKLLVYIPYYINDGIDSLTASWMGLATTTLPAIINSDFTILDASSTLNQTLKYLSDTGNNHLKDKFIPLGSPKIDKIINSKKEDFTIPISWQSLINNKSNPKLIFLNTHMFIFLNNSADYFDKLTRIFETFSKRKGVLLWWRPHPNTELNFKRFSPSLYNAYLKLIDFYKTSKIGIYDDTADVHRAITLTDAYYGDNSSVLQMYKITGKPIMLMNFNENNPQMSWFYVLGDYALFQLKDTPNLLKLNLVTMEVANVDTFQNLGNYISPMLVGDNLYLVPVKFGAPIAFNIQISEVKSLPFTIPKNENVVLGSMRINVVHNNIIYFTPMECDAIISYNTITQETVFYTDWVVDYRKKANNPTSTTFFGYPCIANNIIYMPNTTNNLVLTFDIETKAHKIYEVGGKNYKYISISYDNESFWLLPFKNNETPIVQWHPQKNKITQIEQLMDSNITNFFLIECFYRQGYLYFFPFLTYSAYKLNIETKLLSKIKVFSDEKIVSNFNKRTFSASQMVGSVLYTFDESNVSFIGYNTETGEYREKSILFSNVLLTQLRQSSIRQMNRGVDAGENGSNLYTYEETYTNTLDNFLDYISLKDEDSITMQSESNTNQAELCRYLYTNANGTAGQKIYDFARVKVNG